MAPAQARAVAQAINLTPAEMPGYAHVRYHETAADRRALDRVRRCFGMAPRRAAITALSSDGFAATKARGGSATSQVRVMRSTAAAAHDVAAIGSRRARACMRRSDAHAVVTKLRAPVGIGPAVREDTRLRVGGRTHRLAVDQFAFRTGPVEVILAFAALDRRPDEDEERRLLAGLLIRARQAVP
jgi:hypothetical protein